HVHRLPIARAQTYVTGSIHPNQPAIQRSLPAGVESSDAEGFVVIIVLTGADNLCVQARDSDPAFRHDGWSPNSRVPKLRVASGGNLAISSKGITESQRKVRDASFGIVVPAQRAVEAVLV